MQQFIDDFEQFLIMHDDFFSQYPAFSWGIIVTLLVIAIIDGLRAHFYRKKVRVYYTTTDCSYLCKYKCYWSKKLKADIVVPEAFAEDFKCDTGFIKDYRLVVKK